MNISQVLLGISQKFSKIKIDNSNLEAEMLLSFVLEKPKEFLFAHREEKISFWQNLKINSLVVKRLKGYSLAVLGGEKEFYKRKFYVNKNILIPRPETEIIVQHALDELRITNYELRNINLIDVGTGSGCIIVSLIKEIENNFQFQISNIQFQAIDISEKALKVAKRNAKAHNVYSHIEFVKSDLLAELVKRNEKLDGLTLITANLPYLTPEQIKDSPSIQKEPRIALVAGDDGLLYYRRLFKQLVVIKNEIASSSSTSRNDRRIIVFCEIDESQVDGIRELIGEIIGEIEIEIKKDLQGLDRLVIIKLF